MQFLTATFVLFASVNVQCAEGSDAEQKEIEKQEKEQSDNCREQRAYVVGLMKATQVSRLQAQRRNYVSGHGDCSCVSCLTKKKSYHSRRY